LHLPTVTVAACLIALSAAAGLADELGGPYRPDEHTILLMHFDEPGDPADASDRDVYAQNWGAESVDGRFGRALHFNGETDVCVFSEDFTLPPRSTVELWLRIEPGEFLPSRYLLGKPHEWGIALGEPDLLYAGIGLDGEDATIHTRLPQALDDGHWHYLASIYDATSHEYWIYLDGRLVKHQQAGQGDIRRRKYGSLQIGDLEIGPGKEFRGAIDEVRISDLCRARGRETLQLEPPPAPESEPPR